MIPAVQRKAKCTKPPPDVRTPPNQVYIMQCTLNLFIICASVSSELYFYISPIDVCIHLGMSVVTIATTPLPTSAAV